MAKINSKQYIIAIGASAGGLEAISQFFDYTPLDGVSYIIIQHLSADYKSQMAEILDRHSKLEVIEATHNVAIKPNTVYLIPSSSFMVVENGTLKLTVKKDQPKPHMTIDYFFESLAEERGDKAIGVILSGTGHDGSNGISAIKKTGGIALVQEPNSATFKEMPLTAIATGCADAIVSPKAMPQIIEEYVLKDGDMEFDDPANIDITNDELYHIIDLIKGNLPLDFSDYKKPTIHRRMDQNNFIRVEQYLQLLRKNPEEIELLANDFLIGVSAFFRDADAFKIIEEKVIPDIIQNLKDEEVLKIWVAGCATGEEAYSLAILIKEYLKKTRTTLEVKIFATDINKVSLDRASKGVYTDRLEKTMSKDRLQEFFIQNGDSYKVKHEIRKMLIFAQHDLTKNPPYCNVNLISCRNLLIYMNPVLQKKVFSMMHFGLKKNGYLFLGPSESAAIIKDDFTEISGKWNILKSTHKRSSVKFDAFTSPVIGELRTRYPEVTKKSPAPEPKSDFTDQMNTTIVQKSGISGICTDENLVVIYSFGDTKPYLKNENFNHNLNELLPEGISIRVKSAAHKALNLNKQVVLNDLNFGGKAKSKGKKVCIEIKPFFKDASEEKLLLILFTEIKEKSNEAHIIQDRDINQLTKEHLHNLERELTEARHELAVAYERLESSNENMQSFNEELQSANEEMQSANEEMQSTNEELQSVNEELQTINKEYQLTNTELRETNDDLNNYFRSNLNGQLFVDENLLLKRYSPGAVKHINIRESDIGRPLSNITTNIKFETLIADIKKVISDDATITREVESTEGKIYQVMTMPYVRQQSKKADGAIISFHDITELKGLMSELVISNESLLRINADLNNFVHGASHDLNAPINNIEALMRLLTRKIDISDPAVSKLILMIESGIKNFKGVIKDLALIGKIESEMGEDNYENFADIFNEVSATISEKIHLSQAVLEVDFQEKEIRFPKKYLRSIILNL
ncbi:MAG TPA: chemotaxis protein CheB [Sphingobacteriaceae bacterium]|nr:chemotaxis protein CheB [Sphingobacteriaceae bacterium]